jgi:hypothetical protein
MKERDRADPEQPRGSPIHNEGQEDASDDNGIARRRVSQQIMHADIEHVHGPEEVAYGKNELVVLCLVRDGQPYIRSFLEHYSSMGVKHLVFLDNGSTDGTVEALKEYDNVTVLRTTLPFNKANHMRRYLTGRFGQGRWSLYVDIDELFDYPYSDVIGLDSLLEYLDRNSYTAVVAYMLDMFPEEHLSGQSGSSDEPLKKLHRFYDLSNLKGRRIREHPSCPPDNTYGNDEIRTFSGGIRWTVFGTSTFLTKHPLVFLDGKVRPFAGGPHWHGNVRAADFTGVLFHYKFLDEHLHRYVARMAQEEQHWNSAANYKRYLEVLENTPSLSIMTDTSRELKSVNDLVGTRLLTVSRQYMRFVEGEERRNGYSEESRSERLFEAFFNAREEVMALVEEKQKMLRENERLRRQNERLRQQNKKLAEQAKTMRHEYKKLKVLAEQVQTTLQEYQRAIR